MNKVRVGIVGAGKRVNYLYGPLVRLLKDDLDLVGICSRRMETAQAVADNYQVSAFDDIDKLVEGVHPDLLIVSVTHAANGEVGRQLGRRHRAATSRASSGNTPSYRLRTALPQHRRDGRPFRGPTSRPPEDVAARRLYLEEAAVVTCRPGLSVGRNTPGW